MSETPPSAALVALKSGIVLSPEIAKREALSSPTEVIRDRYVIVMRWMTERLTFAFRCSSDRLWSFLSLYNTNSNTKNIMATRVPYEKKRLSQGSQKKSDLTNLHIEIVKKKNSKSGRIQTSYPLAHCEHSRLSVKPI